MKSTHRHYVIKNQSIKISQTKTRNRGENEEEIKVTRMIMKFELWKRKMTLVFSSGEKTSHLFANFIINF